MPELEGRSSSHLKASWAKDLATRPLRAQYRSGAAASYATSTLVTTTGLASHNFKASVKQVSSWWIYAFDAMTMSELTVPPAWTCTPSSQHALSASTSPSGRPLFRGRRPRRPTRELAPVVNDQLIISQGPGQGVLPRR